MSEKIADKVIGRGIVKRKSEDEGDQEIKQDFVVYELGALYWEKISEVVFQKLKLKEGYEFEIILKTKQLSKKEYKYQSEKNEKLFIPKKRPEPRSLGVLRVDGL